MWRRILIQAVARSNVTRYRIFAKSGWRPLICYRKLWESSNFAFNQENTWRSNVMRYRIFSKSGSSSPLSSLVDHWGAALKICAPDSSISFGCVAKPGSLQTFPLSTLQCYRPTVFSVCPSVSLPQQFPEELLSQGRCWILSGRSPLNSIYHGETCVTSNFASKQEDSWKNKYNSRNDSRWNNFAHTRTILPAFLIMAVGFNHEDTHSSGAEILKVKDDVILDLLEKGEQMLDTKCSPESVEKVFTEALNLALTKEDKSVIAYIQNKLANLAIEQEQFEIADKLLREVIRNLLDSGMNQNNIIIMETALKHAISCTGTGNRDLAASAYEWVIERCHENLKTLENNPKTEAEYNNQIVLLGAALDSYERDLYINGDYKQALGIAAEARKFSTVLFDERKVATLVRFINIGAILHGLGEVEEAAKITESTVLVVNEGKYHDHAGLAFFWMNLSNIYKIQGNFEKMTEAFGNARKEVNLANDETLRARMEKLIKHVGET